MSKRRGQERRRRVDRVVDRPGARHGHPPGQQHVVPAQRPHHLGLDEKEREVWSERARVARPPAGCVGTPRRARPCLRRRPTDAAPVRREDRSGPRDAPRTDPRASAGSSFALPARSGARNRGRARRACRRARTAPGRCPATTPRPPHQQAVRRPPWPRPRPARRRPACGRGRAGRPLRPSPRPRCACAGEPGRTV